MIPAKPHKHLRSPKWEAWVKAFLVGKVCAACGGTEQLEGHHVTPFHVDQARELDMANVIPLCMAPGRWCHFREGHRWNWHQWVPNLRTVLAAWRAAKVCS